MRRRILAGAAAAVLVAGVGLTLFRCGADPAGTDPTVAAPAGLDPPSAAGSAAPSGGTGAVRPIEDGNARHNTFDVPDRMHPFSLDFAAADTGYALFADCSSGCTGRLYVTLDGGSSWLPRQLPVDKAELFGVHAVDARTVVVSTGTPTSDWFRSEDTGRTFVKGGTGFPDQSVVERGVTTGCTGAATSNECRPQVLADGRPLPTQPPLPGNLGSVTRAGTGPIWAVSAVGTTVHTARSADGGRTWQRFGPPVEVPEARLLRVMVSADGADAWLAAGMWNNLHTVYLAEAAGWRQVKADLLLESGYTDLAPAGGGKLLVAADRLGYLDGNGVLDPAGLQARAVQTVRLLGDGTLQMSVAPDDVWLGTGTGSARSWAHVRVDAV